MVIYIEIWDEHKTTRKVFILSLSPSNPHLITYTRNDFPIFPSRSEKKPPFLSTTFFFERKWDNFLSAASSSLIRLAKERRQTKLAWEAEERKENFWLL
jgi:hypothetical protein